MPIIKPISDLRNKFNEISEICHKEGEPIFITKNGKGDMVIMSIAKYEQIEARLELYEKLSIAEYQSSNQNARISHKSVITKMRKMLGD